MSPILVCSSKGMICASPYGDDLVQISSCNLTCVTQISQKKFALNMETNEIYIFKRNLLCPKSLEMKYQIGFNLVYMTGFVDVDCNTYLLLIDDIGNAHKLLVDFFTVLPKGSATKIAKLIDFQTTSLVRVIHQDGMWYIVHTNDAQHTHVRVHGPNLDFAFSFQIFEGNVSDVILKGTHFIFSEQNKLHWYDLIKGSITRSVSLFNVGEISSFTYGFDELICASNETIFIVNIDSLEILRTAKVSGRVHDVIFLENDFKYSICEWKQEFVRVAPRAIVGLVSNVNGLRSQGPQGVPHDSVYPTKDLFYVDGAVDFHDFDFALKSADLNQNMFIEENSISVGQGTPWYHFQTRLPSNEYDKVREVIEINRTNETEYGGTFFLYIHPKTKCVHAIPDMACYAKFLLIKSNELLWRSSIAVTCNRHSNVIYMKSIQERKEQF